MRRPQLKDITNQTPPQFQNQNGATTKLPEKYTAAHSKYSSKASKYLPTEIETRRGKWTGMNQSK